MWCAELSWRTEVERLKAGSGRPQKYAAAGLRRVLGISRYHVYTLFITTLTARVFGVRQSTLSFQPPHT